MLNRSKGIDQTKSDPLVLQVGKPDALMIQPKWRVLLLEPSGCSWAKASRSPKANMSHSSPQETDHHWLLEHKALCAYWRNERWWWWWWSLLWLSWLLWHFLRTLLTRYHFHKMQKKCVYGHGVSFEGRFGDNVSGRMNAVIGKFFHRFTPLFFKFKTTLLLQLNIWFVNSKLN